MKITCAVEISNRSYAGSTIRNKKYSVATLTLSYSSNGAVYSDNDISLFLSTRQCPKGEIYKVYNNVEKLLTKYITNGKATIRFKEPPHDILISRAESEQLKYFVRGIDLIIMGKASEHLKFSMAPNKFDPVKTKMSIGNSDDYAQNPVIPISLITLNVVHCFISKVDYRILRLKNLQVLNLSRNCIEELPLELADIPLKQLVLKHNEISSFPKALAIGALGQNLQFLDLSFNKLTELSPYFCVMKKISSLFLCGNKVTQLPRNIQCLESLKNLRASYNNLQILPFAIHTLHLDVLDISYNPLDADVKSCSKIIMDRPRSLLEFAAAVIVEQKVSYSRSDLPTNLVDYLINVCPCICGRKVFHNKYFYCAYISDRGQIASLVIHNLSSFKVPMKVYFCSIDCSEKKK